MRDYMDTFQAASTALSQHCRRFHSIGKREAGDKAGGGINTKMQFSPGATGLGAVLLNQPLARAAQIQPGGIDQQMHDLSIGTAGMAATAVAFSGSPLGGLTWCD